MNTSEILHFWVNIGTFSQEKTSGFFLENQAPFMTFQFHAINYKKLVI